VALGGDQQDERRGAGEQGHDGAPGEQIAGTAGDRVGA
jgi:hypothetical protein